MLEPDVGEHGDTGVDRVGGIEATAEPGLDDGDVDAGGGELAERCGGQQLELRHAVVGFGLGAIDELGGTDRARDRRGEALGLDVLLVDAYPFAVAQQVRRGEAAGTQPVAFENCRAHPRRR